MLRRPSRTASRARRALVGAGIAVALASAASCGRVRTNPAGSEAKRDMAMRVGALGDPAAAPEIVPLLDDRDEVVRATAAGALGRLRARVATGALLERLGKEKRPFVRKAIAYALGEIGDPGTVAPLAERSAREKDKEVRAALVTALGQIADRGAVPALRARLDDKEAFVRREAARALGLVGDRAVVPDLVARLRGDREADVRRHAAEALGRLGDARARDALSAAVHDPDPYVADTAVAALAALDGAAEPRGKTQ